MATVDPVEEWRRLSLLYSEMGEVELLELKDAFGDLTEVAQDVLRSELEKRQLWDLPLPEILSPEVHVGKRARASLDDLLLGGVNVGEFDSLKEANLAAHVLELAGIQAAAVEGHGRFDVRPPSVCVAPEDAERASAVLAQPIPAQIRSDYEALDMPDFEVPPCPHCASGEVLLEAFEPNNQWLCEECGHCWEDAAPTP